MKRKISIVLDKYRNYTYYYMPVPGGYGRVTLDYLGFCCGLGFAIEAKRSDGKVSPRQEVTIGLIEEAGVPVFIIKDDETLATLDRWLSAAVRGGNRYVNVARG